MAMLRKARGHVLAVLLTLLAASTGYAQARFGVPAALSLTPGDMPPPEPAYPVAPTAPPLVPPPAPPWKCAPEIPPASIWPIGHPGGPPATAPFEDCNGPVLSGDSLVESPPNTPGWIGAVELAGVVPHIKNRLTEPVTLTNGVTDTVHLPTAELGGRVMPTIVLGYRCDQAAGEFTISYRFIAAQNSQFVSAADLPAFAPTGAAVKSRLDLQVLDLDYGSYEPSLGPLWTMKWKIGARGVIAYSDSQGFNDAVAQQTTNRFWGIGPHAALELRRWLGDSGVALFGRIDMSVPIGRLAQNYVDMTAPASGEARFFQNMPQLSLNVQFGVTWTPTDCDCFHVSAGYIYEHWWDLGALGAFAPVARQELWIQGGFLRAEWNY
jgi:hypothetical protein